MTANQPKQTLNVAMIGQGFMGRAHSNAFHQVTRFFDTPYDLRLKVICGRNRESLEAMAKRWGWEETSTDWEAVVARKDIDVIDVATPNLLHAPIAIAAAKAGKIVLCEKPLAMSVDEAERMATAARNVPNLVWFNYRRVPAVSLAKRLVDEGRLGNVYHYRSVYLQSWGADPARKGVWRFNRAEAGSGAIGDLLTHTLDLALLLNGEIEELSAMIQTFAPGREVDDAVLLLARFANGSIGSFEATRFAIGCKNRNAFDINGSKGMLRFNLEDLNRLEFFDATDPTHIQGEHQVLVTGPGHPYVDRYWPPGHIIGYEHTFISSLADFLDALARKETFHPNFDDAVRVQRLVEAVERSAKDGAWVRVEKTAPGKHKAAS
ncbi:MAG TPA: Gfo/Idh/MocA family oxidoreductase [Terriglobales bacterium]|nr:Gfo/Idh/MocA family oxidoreductase [Terriglobales bacterium]